MKIVINIWKFPIFPFLLLKEKLPCFDITQDNKVAQREKNPNNYEVTKALHLSFLIAII